MDRDLVTSSSVAVSYSGPRDEWQVDVPVETVVELLETFRGKHRAFLVRLLNGYSKKAAAVAVGVVVNPLARARRSDAPTRMRSLMPL